MLSCATLKAQDKIGYLNVQELLVIMPEYELVNDSLIAIAHHAQDMHLGLQNEYNRLYDMFTGCTYGISEDTLRARVQEFNDLERKFSQMEENSEQLLLEKQAELMFPLEQRIMAAINSVAEEHGYTYIVDSSVMDVSPIVTDAEDIFPLVMQKLGGSWVSEAP